MLPGQKTVSVLKKKGLGAKGEFMKMHLAVYPCEIEFLNNVQYQTAFYFEKNFQVIGEIHQSISPSEKGKKLQTHDINNIVNFRLYSANNVVYKWSVYRRYENGEEEYLDSCTLNLKEAVNNFIIPQNGFASHSNASMISLGFINKEMRLKFPKIGVILIFMLFVAEDPRIIRDYVQNKLISKDEDHILENIPPTNLLKADSNSGIVGLSSRRNQNSNFSGQNMSKKKSSLNNGDRFSSQLKSKENTLEPVPNDKKGELSDNLQNLIMNFDGNAHSNPIITEEIIINQQNNNKLRADKGQAQEDGLHRLQDNQTAKKQSQAIPNLNASTQRLGEWADYGVLKLQSDQGRVTQQPIDKKLQLEQLQAIEQERTSRGDNLQSQFMNSAKTKLNKSMTPKQKSQAAIKQATQQSEMETPSRFNMKKIFFVAILSIMLFIVAATLSRNVHRRKQKKGGRSK